MHMHSMNWQNSVLNESGGKVNVRGNNAKLRVNAMRLEGYPLYQHDPIRACEG